MYYKKHLTQPSAHNPNDFTYLVHAVIDHEGNGISEALIKAKLDAVRDSTKLYRASLIANLDHEVAMRRVSKFCAKGYSIQRAFGPAGLIVEPGDDKDIRIAWKYDIGSPDGEKLKDFVKKHDGKKLGFLSLLADTEEYNELIIRGNPNSMVAGVFSYQDKKYREKSRKVHELASRLIGKDLPLIEIPYDGDVSSNHLFAQSMVRAIEFQNYRDPKDMLVSYDL